MQFMGLNLQHRGVYMKTYYVLIDENSYITGWSEDFFVEENSIAVEVDEEIFEDFELYFDGYQAVEGVAIKDTDAYQISVNNRLKDVYRYEREMEVFPIINRGEAWYRTLTEEQKNELQIWYEAWLNVTDTLEPPQKPEWIV